MLCPASTSWAISVYGRLGSNPDSVIFHFAITENEGRTGCVLKTDANGSGLIGQWYNNDHWDGGTLEVAKTSAFLNEWHHYVVVGHTTQYASLYIDGILVKNLRISSRNWAGSKKFRWLGIGRRYRNPGNRPETETDGSMQFDDIRLYVPTDGGDALNATQVANLYAELTQNAAISFDAPKAIADAGDVLNETPLQFAYAGGSSAATVADVPFAAVASAEAPQWTVAGSPYSSSGHAAGLAAVGSEYQALLDGARGVDSSVMYSTLTGLTVGQRYALQLWFQDSTAAAGKTVDVGIGDSVKRVTYNADGRGQVLTGEFTAKSARQLIVVNGAASTVSSLLINALQVRLGGTERLEWDEAVGTWNTTGNNWVGHTAEETLWRNPDGFAYDALVARKGATMSVEGSLAAHNLTVTDAGLAFAEGETKAAVSLTGATGASLELNKLTVNLTNSSLAVSLPISTLSDATLAYVGDMKLGSPLTVGGVLTKTGKDRLEGTISADGYALGYNCIAANNLAKTTFPVTFTDAPSVKGDGSQRGWGFHAKFMSNNSYTLTDVTGIGNLESSENIAFDIPEGQSTKVTGQVTAKTFTKKGAGTLTLLGTSTVAKNGSGAFTLEEGTLKIGGLADFDDIAWDFDASDAAAFDDSGETPVWTSSRGDTTVTLTPKTGSAAPVRTTAENMMNGLPVVTSDKIAMTTSAAKPILTTALVAQPRTETITWHGLLYDADSTGYNLRIDSATGWMRAYRNGSQTTPSDTWMNDGYEYKGYFTLDPNVAIRVAPWTASWNSDGVARVQVGGETATAWAEVIAFSREITMEERNALNAILKQKWGINPTAYAVLPVMSAFTMKSGTTLDLGGFQQTVASFAGSGTVTNGRLVTTDQRVTVTGPLTIPAVEGTTYALTSADATLELTGSAQVTIEVPETYFGEETEHVSVVGVTSAVKPTFTLPQGWSIFPGEAPGTWEIANFVRGFVISIR